MDKKPHKRSIAGIRNKINQPGGERHAIDYDDIDRGNTVMYNECTGMMYSPPYDEAELESYQSLSDITSLEKEADSEHNGTHTQKK